MGRVYTVKIENPENTLVTPKRDSGLSAISYLNVCFLICLSSFFYIILFLVDFKFRVHGLQCLVGGDSLFVFLVCLENFKC